MYIILVICQQIAFVLITLICKIKYATKRAMDDITRGVGRGGSKGLDEPPFQTRFLKNYSYCYFNTNNIIKHYNF